MKKAAHPNFCSIRETLSDLFSFLIKYSWFEQKTRFSPAF